MRHALIALALFTVTLGAQAPDRSKPPALGPAPAVKLPTIQKRQLSNGLPVWIVEVHKVPVVEVDLLVASGSADEPSGKYGIASLTAAMLTNGAGSRSALEVADAVDFLGADLTAQSGIDSATVMLHSSVARLAEALPIMSDVATRPTFPKDDLERLRQQRLTGLVQARDSAETLVQLGLARVLFGTTHRFGTPTMGTADTIKAFTTDDLRAYDAAMYRPDNATIVVAGDVTPNAIMPLLESSLGKWKATGTAAARVRLPAPPDRSEREVYLRRHARSAAVTNPYRCGWRRALDTGLLSGSGNEHDSRRVVRVEAQHEPAREARLHLRCPLDVRYARVRRPVPRNGWRADRQDVRGAEGILQRAERHPAAGHTRGADAREELCVAAFPGTVRDNDGHHRTSRGAARLPPARRLLLKVRCGTYRR